MQADWWIANPEPELIQFKSNAILLGVSVAQLVYEERNARAIPILHNWDMRFVKWNGATRTWTTQIDKGADVTITPGDGRWMMQTPYGSSRPWRFGVWRAVAYWWLLKQYARTDWARYSEAHGKPVLAGYMPEGKSADKTARKTLADDLANLGSNASVALPAGYDIKLIEATANTWGTFQKQIEMADAGIAVAILGQNLTTRVSGGSRAAAQIHDVVRNDIIEADARGDETVLREQQWMTWTELNFGNKELTPWMHWNTQPPEDLKAEAETIAAIVPQLATLKGLGADVDALLERFHIPKLTTNSALSKLTLSSGTSPKRAKGFIRGQLHTDDLADNAITSSVNDVSNDLDAILKVILESADYESLRHNVTEAYQGLEPETLATRIEQAMILAELTGRWAVLEDEQ
jgi:phage gp29-like protein